MRLTVKDRQGILEGIRDVIQPLNGDVYLFGSRVIDTAKGGDIDLLLLCDPASQSEVSALKLKILVSIEKRIGERRVDLTISSRNPAEQSEFVRSIVSKAQLLS